MCFVRRRSRARSGSSPRPEPSWSCSSQEPAKARPGGAQPILPDRLPCLSQPEIPDCQSKPARRRIREGIGGKRGLASPATWQPADPKSSGWFCAPKKSNSTDWPCRKITPFSCQSILFFDSRTIFVASPDAGRNCAVARSSPRHSVERVKLRFSGAAGSLMRGPPRGPAHPGGGTPLATRRRRPVNAAGPNRRAPERPSGKQDRCFLFRARGRRAPLRRGRSRS